MRPVSDVGLVVVLPPGRVAHVMALVLDSPVLADVGVQVGGADPAGGAAGDDERVFLADSRAVEGADVAADAADLRGVGKVDSVGVGSPGGPAGNPPVAAFLDDVPGLAGQPG